MPSLKQSRNVAARMGHWSARHRKIAIFGWLGFVIASFAIGMQIGTNYIQPADANVGEARKADHMLEDAGFFKLDEQRESVIIQSKTLTVDDPTFKAAITDVANTLNAFPKVQELRSPLAAGHTDQVSKDRHSALIQFRPKGDYDEAITYIDTIVAAVNGVESAHPGFYIAESGSASTKKLSAKASKAASKPRE